jgi:hypothetical protein
MLIAPFQKAYALDMRSVIANLKSNKPLPCYLNDQEAKAYFQEVKPKTKPGYNSVIAFYQVTNNNEEARLCVGFYRLRISIGPSGPTGGLESRVCTDNDLDGIPDSTFIRYTPQDKSGINFSQSFCGVPSQECMESLEPTQADSSNFSAALTILE